MIHCLSHRVLTGMGLLFLPSMLSAQVFDTTVVTTGVALQLPKGYAETIIAPNPVEAALVRGKWQAPVAGEGVRFADGERREWQPLIADSTGWFEDSVLLGCYVSLCMEMKKKAVVILAAMGNEMVYVNGVPRSGNPYGLKEHWEAWEPNFQYSLLPVVLEEGKNEFLFRCQRGRLKLTLYPCPRPVVLNPGDITVPDFIVGEEIDTHGAIPVINASPRMLKNLVIETRVADRTPVVSNVPIIQPFSVRKVGFRITGDAFIEPGATRLLVILREEGTGAKNLLDSLSIPFRVVKKSENHKETFISTIDGSVQYYGITPSTDPDQDQPQALFLSLHGAGVEALNQSGSYYPKPWGHIVAPTNRRPYGYNWEDWGRTDALEVLETIKHRYTIDEDRIYLTGHSMGGHGVWHIGSLFPDQFAAIGPSAGWISFWTYRFRGQEALDTTEIRTMIRRSTTPSETFLHIDNYRQHGVYVLHGADDDNVSPEQARMMVKQLRGVHNDLVYHEQQGAGHWWDLSDERGVDCVDWAPMFDFFARHAKPQNERIRQIAFTTANPGVSSTHSWLTIDAQREQLKISSATIQFDPGLHQFVGTTDNIARCAFDLDIVRTTDTLTVMLDSQRVVIRNVPSDDGRLWMSKSDGLWVVSNSPPPSQKGAQRYGTLKGAFRNRMMFIYGTIGSREENQWSFNKARYDAEKFWYQGNGSIDVIADTAFDSRKEIDRNVILYGNRNTNKAWNPLLTDSPVEVGTGFVRIDKRTLSGNDVCCIVVRPRAGSRTASIAAISGTGIVGMKLSNRLPYLNPGIGLPDCTVMNAHVLTAGEPGILMTGFFGLDWSVTNGEFVWQSGD